MKTISMLTKFHQFLINYLPITMIKQSIANTNLKYFYPRRTNVRGVNVKGAIGYLLLCVSDV